MKPIRPAYPLLFKLSLALVIGVTLIALAGPWLGAPSHIIHPDNPLVGPFQSSFWLGTDDLGRDLFSRVAIGARISLFIGVATAVVASLFGTFYGMIAASNPGRLDNLMMRIVDVLYSLPGLMIVILFSVFFGRTVFSLVLALALFSWPDTARVVRGEVLRIQQEEYIEAFRCMGGTWWRLVRRYYIPNLMGVIILTGTITIPRAILTESTLSFIGLGVEPPMSSWGTLASEGWQLVRIAPHLLLIPSAFIVLTMVALNLIGDTLRVRTDPKS